MGAPKPYPTRWPEPELPYSPDETEWEDDEPTPDPDYDVEIDPREGPHHLPEERATPYAVTWAVTHRCNLRCDHCYDAVSRPRTDLTTNQALQVVDRLAQAGIRFIAFSGGEPLLRRDLFQLMEHCGVLGIQVGMRSNGTLITPDIARHLAAVDLRVAGISLDGVDAETHDLVRGQDSFQKTREGIRALLALRVRVNVEVVLSRRNVHQSLDFVRLAEAWGVDEINFSAITAHGRAEQLDDMLLDHQTWRDVTTQLYHASQTARVTVSPSCALTGACWACVEPNITCDGWVTPCYLSRKKLFHILETSQKEFAKLLSRSRPETVGICGRGHWVYPSHEPVQRIEYT